VSSCAACGAQIIWRETPAGKTMPVDANPAPEGNVLIEGSKCLVLGPLEVQARESGDLHLSHFATCPQAARFRK
jgi:hypothetical protein